MRPWHKENATRQRSQHITVWIERGSLIALGLTALLMLFARRVQREFTAGAAQQDVVVRYWEKWTGVEAAQLQEVVDDFNSTVGREKHIQVQCLSINEVDQKTLLAVAAGVPPDVVGLWDQQVAQFAALGVVQPLDALARSHGISEQTYLPVFWRGCHYQGRLYALVSTAAPIALLYNPQLLRACGPQLHAEGFDPDRAPRSIPELDGYARILTRWDPRHRLERAGYLPLQSWYVPFTCYWFGGDIFDPQTGRFTLTSPAFVASYRWIQSYYRRVDAEALQDFGGAYPLAAFNSPQSPFLNGALAMQQDGPWVSGVIARFRPTLQSPAPDLDDKGTAASTNPGGAPAIAWAFAPFPSALGHNQQVSFCTYDTLMIPSGAAHPNEAFEWIAYLNRQDVSEKLNRLHGTLPPLRTISDAFLNQSADPYIRTFEAMAANPNAHGVPPVPIWPEVWKALIDTAQAVTFDGVDPSAVLATAQTRLQSSYDRFQRSHEHPN